MVFGLKELVGSKLSMVTTRLVWAIRLHVKRGKIEDRLSQRCFVCVFFRRNISQCYSAIAIYEIQCLWYVALTAGMSICTRCLGCCRLFRLRWEGRSVDIGKIVSVDDHSGHICLYGFTGWWAHSSLRGARVVFRVPSRSDFCLLRGFYYLRFLVSRL